jgi:hypothetical protein
MADQFVQVPSDSTGKKIDTSELTVGANTVERQRMVISDSTSATALATVTASNALKVDGSAVTQPVSGTITAVTAITNPLPSGTNVIGHVIADTGSTTTVTGNVAVTNAGLTNLDVALSTRTKPADQQHTILDSGTLTSITNALPTGTNTIGNVGDLATATGLTPAYTEGTLSAITQTLAGRLKVDLDLADVQRRLLEVQSLTDYANMMENIITAESENSQRMGYEVR